MQRFSLDNYGQSVAVFSRDVIFYGTISPALLTTTEDVREYFVNTLFNSRREVKANVFGTTAAQHSDRLVLVTATWRSERTLEGEMTTNGPPRNTSVMHKQGER